MLGHPINESRDRLLRATIVLIPAHRTGYFLTGTYPVWEAHQTAFYSKP